MTAIANAIIPGQFLDIGGAILNVKHPTFGAVGDGSTDDTAAIQAAIDASVALVDSSGLYGGFPVYLPPGSYKTTSMLHFQKSGIYIIGAGQNATEIAYTPAIATGDPCFRIGGTAMGTRIESVGLIGLTLRGKNANTADGLQIQYQVNDCLLDMVHVALFYNHGININNNVNQTTIRKCRLSQNGIATSDFNIYCDTDVNGVNITGCRIREAGDADSKGSVVYSSSIKFSGVGYNIEGNIFEKNGYAIFVGSSQPSYGINIHGNYMEWNTSYGIRLDGSTTSLRGVSMQGNYFDLTKASGGVYLEDADGISIQANNFVDESGHTAAQGCIHIVAGVTDSVIGPNTITTNGTAPVHVKNADAPETCINITFNDKTVTTTGAADTTPSVAGKTLFKSGGAVTITDFDNGVIGQTFTFLAAHAVTITDGSNILLSGSTNFVMAAGDTLTLTMFNSQVWEEVSRKVNL